MTSVSEVKDIYTVDTRIKSAILRIHRYDINPHNKELIIKFLDYIKVQGVSKYRIVYYACKLPIISQMNNKDFDKMDKDDIIKIVSAISDRNDWSEDTKSNYKITIKRFFKWLYGNDEEMPKEVRWIKTKDKRRDRKLPKDLITEDEFKKLLSCARNIRDGAILWTLWESGVRIGELLNMKYKDLTFDQYGAIAQVDGKTGERRVRLISSTPILSQLVETHPTKEPNSPLWISNQGKPISHSIWRNILKDIITRSGIKKRIYAHLFRHGTATRLASEFTEQELKHYLGWTQASEMAAVYIHMNGAQMDDAIFKMHGMVQQNKKEGTLKPKDCNICSTSNTPDRDWCYRCRHPISEKAKLQSIERERLLLSSITSEGIEAMIQRKIEEILSKPG